MLSIEQQKSTFQAQLQKKCKKSTKSPLKWIPKNITGEKVFLGPFGERDLIRCDFAISGKSLKIIENYLKASVLTLLDDMRVTSRKQLGELREQARLTIDTAVNSQGRFVVVFTDYDLKFSIEKVMACLDYSKAEIEKDESKPIVFIGADLFSKYGRLLKELNVEPTKVADDSNQLVNTNSLELFLKYYKKQERKMLGIFSSASNLTGAVADTVTITSLMHSYGALVFWDYSTAGPYTRINMSPDFVVDQSDVKDIIFFQPSKFLGGNRSPGVLIIRGDLLKVPIFERTESGILAVVSENGVPRRYMTDPPRHSEEYPKINDSLMIEPIRAGLAIELKMTIGESYIEQKARDIYKIFYANLRENGNIRILSNSKEGKLPIFSIMLFHQSTEWALHHNYICVLLRDLFGIKCVTGTITNDECLDTPESDVERLMHSLVNRDKDSGLEYEEVMKVGVVNLTLPYYLKDDEVVYITDALKLISEEGWRLMPHYEFNSETGVWRSNEVLFVEGDWQCNTLLKIVSIKDNSSNASKSRHAAYLYRAQKLLKRAKASYFTRVLQRNNQTDVQDDSCLSPESKNYRWFMVPSEALDLLKNGKLAYSMSERSVFKTRRPAFNKKIALKVPSTPPLAEDQSYKRLFQHDT